MTLAILGAAFLLGAATLVRPIGFLSPLLAPIPLLFIRETNFKRKTFLAIAAFLVPALIAGAWIIRNGRSTGIWTLSTVGAYDLYNYRAAGIVSSRNGGNLADAMIALAHEQGFSKPPEYYSRELYHDTIRRSIRILTTDPLATARMTIRAFLWLTVVPDRSDLNIFLGLHGGTSVTYAASEGIALRLHDLLRSPALTGLDGGAITLSTLLTLALRDCTCAPARFVNSGAACTVEVGMNAICCPIIVDAPQSFGFIGPMSGVGIAPAAACKYPVTAS